MFLPHKFNQLRKNTNYVILIYYITNLFNFPYNLVFICSEKGSIMVEHIVLLKLKSGITSTQLESLGEALQRMAGEIPGITSITAGTNNSPEGKNQGYDYGFIVRFTDETARDAYLPHPFHRQVAGEHIRPLIEDVLVFDYTA